MEHEGLVDQAAEEIDALLLFSSSRWLPGESLSTRSKSVLSLETKKLVKSPTSMEAPVSPQPRESVAALRPEICSIGQSPHPNFQGMGEQGHPESPLVKKLRKEEWCPKGFSRRSGKVSEGARKESSYRRRPCGDDSVPALKRAGRTSGASPLLALLGGFG